ncbi:MAG: ABC transporter permease subunit [Christensenellales bacterium]
MRSFGYAFSGECYKIFRKGKIFILLGILIAIALLLTFCFELVQDISGAFDTTVDMEMIDEQIEQIQYVIDNYTPTIKIGLIDTELYQLKATLAYLKYLKANNLRSSDFYLAGQEGYDSAGYIDAILNTSFGIIAIFAIIIICRSWGGEKSDGTLKMQFMRPIGRKKMYGAKVLSVWCISALVLIALVLFAQVVAMIKFGVATKKVIYVINGSTVGAMPYMAYLALQLLFKLFELFAYIQFGAFMCNLTWKKGSGMALAILAYLFASNIEGLLGYLYVGYVGMFINLDLMSAFTISGPTLKGMNIISMAIISVVYQVAIALFNLRHAERCELA